MADEPLALSTILLAVPADGDYDAICAALRQSERGRWFLEEHARRNRNADPGTFIGAIANTSDPNEYPQQTQTDALAAVERLQDLAWIMREHGLDTAVCEPIEILVSTILSASWLRDPGDRRAQKLGEALGYLERRIDSMIAAAKEHARKHVEVPLGEIAVPIKGAAPEPPRTYGGNESPTDSVSVAAASEPSESAQMVSASIRLDRAEAAALSAELDGDTWETATEATIVRVPTMWEPPDVPFPLASSSSSEAHPPNAKSELADFLLEPLPISWEPSAPASPETMAAAATRRSLPDDLTADIDDELFTAPPAPVLPVAPAAPLSATTGSAPIASTRSDPLAALNAMSDEEKIALFT